MKKISLFLMVVFVVSLFATDVSNFDIKGIKLGMSKNEVLKLMPKGTKFRKWDCIDDSDKCAYPYNYNAFYKNNTESFDIYLTQDIFVYYVLRQVKLRQYANAEKIIQKLTQRYGKPDAVWNHGSIKKLCWGGCYKGKYQFEPKKGRKIFAVLINMKDRRIEFVLQDNELENSMQQYIESVKEKLSNNDSNIDF